MFTISYADHESTIYICDICYSMEFTTKYIINNQNDPILAICSSCFEDDEFKNNLPLSNKNILILRTTGSTSRMCRVCHIHNYDVRICFSGERCTIYYVCLVCISNINLFVPHIPDQFRTRELVEIIHAKFDTTYQRSFALLNAAEKIKIIKERRTIKKYLDLPKVLRNIVLSYYWIFE
jgi:hypothetical protein